MNRLTYAAATALLSVPLFAVAQTTTTAPATTSTTSPTTTTKPSKVQNAETPRSNLEKQQTQEVGDATKYGQDGSDSSSRVNHKDNPKMKKAPKVKSTDNSTSDTTTK